MVSSRTRKTERRSKIDKTLQKHPIENEGLVFHRGDVVVGEQWCAGIHCDEKAHDGHFVEDGEFLVHVLLFSLAYASTWRGANKFHSRILGREISSVGNPSLEVFSS
jgi:hypothetical protein